MVVEGVMRLDEIDLSSSEFAERQLGHGAVETQWRIDDESMRGLRSADVAEQTGPGVMTAEVRDRQIGTSRGIVEPFEIRRCRSGVTHGDARIHEHIEDAVKSVREAGLIIRFIACSRCSCACPVRPER